MLHLAPPASMQPLSASSQLFERILEIICANTDSPTVTSLQAHPLRLCLRQARTRTWPSTSPRARSAGRSSTGSRRCLRPRQQPGERCTQKKEYIIYTLLHSGKILKSVVRSNSLTLVAGSIGEQRYLVRLWRGRCEGLQQVGLEVCIVVLPSIMCYNNIKFLLQARRIVLAASG